MEKRETDIIKLRQQINTQKIKLQSLKVKIQNEDNDYLYDKYERDFNETSKLLKKLTSDLDKEVEADKKEKTAYKKSLTKVKESLSIFNKDTKSNLKVKRHVEEINGIILMIDKYLDKIV